MDQEKASRQNLAAEGIGDKGRDFPLLLPSVIEMPCRVKRCYPIGNLYGNGKLALNPNYFAEIFNGKSVFIPYRDLVTIKQSGARELIAYNKTYHWHLPVDRLARTRRGVCHDDGMTFEHFSFAWERHTNKVERNATK